MKPECKHIYRHLETQRLKSGSFNEHRKPIGSTYIRIDKFYCQKCLKFKDIKLECFVECGHRIPEWYREY